MRGLTMPQVSGIEAVLSHSSTSTRRAIPSSPQIRRTVCLQSPPTTGVDRAEIHANRVKPASRFYHYKQSAKTPEKQNQLELLTGERRGRGGIHPERRPRRKSGVFRGRMTRAQERRCRVSQNARMEAAA